MSLEELTPLLALPECAAAARALEEGNAASAARIVQTIVASKPPAPGDVVRWQLLLARLREQGGDLAGAAASYDLASSAHWPLESYARLGAARALLRAGRARDALARLDAVPPAGPISTAARPLRAEASKLAGEREQAVRLWREQLGGGIQTEELAATALRLAETLLERPATSAAADAQGQAKTGAGPLTSSADAVEALGLTRRAAARGAADARLVRRARDLEQRALEALPAAERARHAQWATGDELFRLDTLVASRTFEDAEPAADALLARLTKAERWSDLGCEASVLRAKALAGERQWGRAADALGEVVQRCRGAELRPRALFLAGKYAASDARNAQAALYYEQLEKEAPQHPLADDARLGAALAHFELGAEARFTELLSTMPDAYPNGDMMLDGVFRLAVRRIERGDWSGAASVLERAASLVEGHDRERGTEQSGRERYFRARAWYQTGEKQRALSAYEAIVRELPLSYYMLHAYARLVEADPFRARRARDDALARSGREPFAFERRPELEQPGFVRALELARVGDIEAAHAEIEAARLTARSTAPAVLWAVALLYARAGSADLSHAVARGLLTDWLARWPAGDWLKAWQIAFPRPYQGIVEREAKRSGIPVPLAYAIMREESAFDPKAVSPANAYGLMQLIEPTAKQHAKPLGLPSDPQSLTRPAVNIALGCRMLGELTRQFAANPLLAVPAYNAGPGRPRRWLREHPNIDFDVWVELIPIIETRRYTKRVLASRAAYAFLYDSSQADPALALPIPTSG
jgi:soluble lytic murein transglycosylase